MLPVTIFIETRTLGGHKKSKFLGIISTQVNPIPFLYLRHPAKYFCPNQSGNAIIQYYPNQSGDVIIQ